MNLVDKDTILQVICGLMKHPQYLSETDKYHLSIDDFSTLFERYVFSAIVNLYEDGAVNITVVDIDNYFNTHKAAKAVFERENGIEYLQDALDFSQEENFPFYYKRLKKFNCLRDLKKMGFSIKNFYEEDLTNPKAKEINDRFESLTISDIFTEIKKSVLSLETNYSSGSGSESVSIGSGINDLVNSLKLRPEIGAPLQGGIFNTVCRGARKSKFYIRSASSGTGKSRSSVGDACYLAFPIRFNTATWTWEVTGNCEKTLFIATEQTKDEIQTMVLAYLTGFNEEKILYSHYSEEELTVLKQALEVVDYFEDNFIYANLPDPNIESIKALVRQNCIVHNVRNVFYDYIFSSPSLLGEFRDLRIREDVALNLLSTALKDLAVELNIFMMSSTQTNAKSDDNSGMKNESAIRGARSIIDKCDIACIVYKPSAEELETIKGLTDTIGCIPNQVIDVYKVRRGRYNNVKIWSFFDYGSCRRTDLFITNERFKEIDGFQEQDFTFDESTAAFLKLTSKLNSGKSIVEPEQIVETPLAEKTQTQDLFKGLI